MKNNQTEPTIESMGDSSGHCADCGAPTASFSNGKRQKRCGACNKSRPAHVAYELTCAGTDCRKSFVARERDAIWCSRTCQSRDMYRAGFREFRCVKCGTAFRSGQSVAKYCGVRCQGSAQSERLKGKPGPKLRIFASNSDKWAAQNAKRRSLTAGDPDFKREDIFERDGWLCQLCCEEIDRSLRWPHPNCATIDHKVPLSVGGQHRADNVQAAHLGCNSRKSNRLEAA